jgi:hypothetical protein
MIDSKNHARSVFDPRIAWALIPACALFLWLFAFIKDFPYGDDWYLLRFFEKYANGQLTFSDLWLQHNEHRIFLPKLIIITTQGLFHYASYPVFILNILFAVSSFLVLSYHIEKTYAMGNGRKTLLYLSLGLIFFSINQYEGWFQAICLHWYMNAFFAILGFYMASILRSDNYPRLFVVFLCGAAALLCYGNGLVYWVVVAGLLAVKYAIRKEVSLQYALAWVPLSLAAILTYFVGYHAYPHELYTLNLSKAVVIFGAFLNFLGSPIISFNHDMPLLAGLIGIRSEAFQGLLLLSAAVAGTCGLFLYARIVRKGLKERGLDLFLFSLVSYVLLNAVMISISRVLVFDGVTDEKVIRTILPIGTHFSPKFLTMLITSAPRYASISSYFWGILLLCLFVQAPHGKGGLTYRSAIAAIIFLSLATYGQKSVGFVKNRYLGMTTISEDIKNSVYSEQVKNLIGDEPVFRNGVRIMKKNKLSVFRESRQ